MSQLEQNLEYHQHWINLIQKKMQDRPLTDEEFTDYKEHKRIYRLLKDQLINPVRYRLRSENTLSGYVSYSEWFDSEYQANHARNDLELAEELYPFMIFTIEQSSSQ